MWETEFKAGKYSVIKVTNPNTYSKHDPWAKRTGQYLSIGVYDGGFSLIQVGYINRLGSDEWEYLNHGYEKGRDFKKDYDEAKDKELFLKSVADCSGLKYIKISS